MVSEVVSASLYNIQDFRKMHWEPRKTQVSVVSKCGQRPHFCFKTQVKRKIRYGSFFD